MGMHCDFQLPSVGLCQLLDFPLSFHFFWEWQFPPQQVSTSSYTLYKNHSKINIQTIFVYELVFDICETFTCWNILSEIFPSSGIIFKQFSCIRSSVNLAAGQIRSSLVSSPGLWKNRMKRYSLKIGPMEPDGGQAIFSISRGIIGLPRFTDKFTCISNIRTIQNQIYYKCIYKWMYTNEVY